MCEFFAEGYQEAKKKRLFMTSSEIIENAIREHWKKLGFACDVVAFFEQKYKDEDKWCRYEEIAFCESSSDLESVEFNNDFCEGQTEVRNIDIVSLSEVLIHYADNVIEERRQEALIAAWKCPKCVDFMICTKAVGNMDGCEDFCLPPWEIDFPEKGEEEE